MSALTPSPRPITVAVPDATTVVAPVAVGLLGTYVVEMQNADEGFWYDITAYAVDTSWRWGRDYASQFGGRPVPFTAQLQLMSPGGLFSKYNAASPYLAMLGRAGRVRLRMTSPVQATLYYGYVLRSEIDSALGGIQTVTLNAIGLMGYLAETKTTSTLARGRLPDGARAVGTPDPTGFTSRAALDVALAGTESAFDEDVISGDTTGVAQFDVWYAHQELFPAAVRLIEASEVGYIGDNSQGGITFHSRHHRYLTKRSTGVQATWSDHEYSVYGPASVKPTDNRDQYNRASVSIPQYTFGSIEKADWVVLYTHPRAGQPDLFLDDGETLTIRADFPNDESPPGAAFINWHTNGLPAENSEETHIVANSAVDGSGTDLIAALSVPKSAYRPARMIDVTYLHDGAPAGRMYFPAFVVAGQIAYDAPPVVAVYEDAEAMARDGPNDYPIDAPYVPAIDAAVYVQHVVATTKDVSPVVEVGFKANHSAAMLEEVVTRDVGDRVHLETDGTGPLSTGIGLVGDFFVESCNHFVTFAQGGIHTAIFHLSEASPTPTLWVLGEATLGVTTALIF